MTLSNPVVVRMFEIFEDQSRTANCQSPSKHAVEPFEASKSVGIFFRKFVNLLRRNGSFGKMLMLCFREKSRPFKVERGTIEIQKRKRGGLNKDLRS